MAPVWLDRKSTTGKMLFYIKAASEKGCDLVVFGEALLPGYPFWLELTGGAKFNSPVQKEIFAYYVSQAVTISAGDLEPIRKLAGEKSIAIIFGFIERAEDRGGHSLFCSLASIGKDGQLHYIHRKLIPTYEERLVWANGDGYGLQVRKLNGFTVGALNCWENWMPLTRAALYAQGMDLQIALWPGSVRNTSDVTRFVAFESRSFVVSVSGLLSRDDIGDSLPYYTEIRQNSQNDWLADGGTCIAGPDGTWVMEPVRYKEGLFVYVLEHRKVLEERQNFDPSGHYTRPDVLKLFVSRERQLPVSFKDSPDILSD